MSSHECQRSGLQLTCRYISLPGVLLSGLGNADWPLLYTNTWTKADLDRAERYYLTLFEAPGAIPALLHGMVRNLLFLPFRAIKLGDS